MESPSSIITSIEKSKSDKFDCLIKILPNGLKALLVSDPESENSSGALGVNIGSLTDKPDEQGLAHFCEHMLFLGTEKYPSENDYDDYLTKNGGESNAYTDDDKTIYYFNVNNDAFEGALDRFSQFFISPKFNKDSVEREINAVDSEFSKNKNNDPWRLDQFFKSQLNPKSPFSQFHTGNKDTLNYPDIRERLLKMYNKYYTSEIMALCLYSNKTLEEMIKLVESLFKDVPKKENFEMPKYDLMKPYDEKILSNFYKIVPIKDKDKLVFRFYFPFCDNYKVNPFSFFTSLLGHEGPNTLTACLKRDNLIIDLLSSSEDYAKIFTVVSIEIILTKKGFDNYKEVIYRVLKYISIIKEKEICERYFNEIKIINQIQFDFRDKEKPIDFVEKYVERFMNYNEDVFTAEFLFKEYDEKLIKKYLDMFSLDNLEIAFISKSFENECNLTEKWYGIKYSKEKLSIKKEDIFSYKCNHIMDYPPENKFYPKNLDIFPNEENKKYPELIINSNNCQVWFKQDNEFNLPRGQIEFEVKFVKNLCNNSEIKNEIISYLYNKIIKLELNEILYMAEESDVEFELNIKYDKLQIKIKGFNDSLKRGLEEFLINIKNLELNNDKHKEMFEMQKQEYIKYLNNMFLKKSYKVNLERVKMLLQTGYNDPKEILECLSTTEITLDDLINFKKNMFLETKSVWLIMGNIKKETALDIVKSTNEIFNLDIDKTITKPFYSKRAIDIQQNVNYIYRFKHPNKSEQDSSIISVYQFGNLEKEQKMYYKILNSFFTQKFYDSLRTKETLGYIVSSTEYTLFEVYHLLFIIQSKVKEPEYCNERIKNFFNEKEKEIREISDEDFNTIVKSLLVEETRKDIDLNEQFERNWDEINVGRYKFNIKEENAEYLKKCNKEGFVAFYEKYFLNEAKILDVQYVCDKHWEDNEKKLKENKNYFSGNNNKRIIIDKIHDFHNCNSFHPCFDNIYYRKINS